MLKLLARKQIVSKSARRLVLGLTSSLALAACTAAPFGPWVHGEVQGTQDDAISPYRRAVDAGEQRQRDDAVLTRDVLEAVEVLRSDANAKAQATKGQVYVDEALFQRVLVVVPMTKKRADDEPGFLDVSPTNPPPADAVLLRWSDSFALAQERSTSYGSPRLLSIERRVTSPYLVADLEIDLQVTGRRHIEGIAATLPDAPAGFIPWRNFRVGGARNLRAPGGSISGEVSLPILSTLGGELAIARGNENTLTVGAIAALAQKPLHRSKVTMKLAMRYDDESGGWKIDSWEWRKFPPAMPRLSWSEGTDTYVDVHVFDGARLPWE